MVLSNLNISSFIWICR